MQIAYFHGRDNTENTELETKFVTSSSHNGKNESM